MGLLESLNRPNYKLSGFFEKLDAQNFGQKDSLLVSSINHPLTALQKGAEYIDSNVKKAINPFSSINDQAEAGLNLAGLVQTGAMPFAPTEGIGTIKSYKIGDIGFDPRFDKRKLEQDRLRNMEVVVDSPDVNKSKISLADYEGHPFITSMSDRTNVGLLNSINGVHVGTDMQGGQDYMFNNPGQVWASASSPVKQIMQKAKELEMLTGKNSLYLPWRMAPTGGDFANMTGETMLRYMSNNMTKKDQRQVNKLIGESISGFKGIGSDEGINQFRTAPDKVRKNLKNALDVNFRDSGGLSLGEARLAVSDPDQLRAADTGLQNVGLIYANAPVVAKSGHRAYPKGVPGEGLGVLDNDFMAYELLPNHAAMRGISDYRNPTQADIRALQMKPYDGLITSGLLKALGY